MPGEFETCLALEEVLQILFNALKWVVGRRDLRGSPPCRRQKLNKRSRKSQRGPSGPNNAKAKVCSLSTGDEANRHALAMSMLMRRMLYMFV